MIERVRRGEGEGEREREAVHGPEMTDSQTLVFTWGIIIYQFCVCVCVCVREREREREREKRVRSLCCLGHWSALERVCGYSVCGVWCVCVCVCVCVCLG